MFMADRREHELDIVQIQNNPAQTSDEHFSEQEQMPPPKFGTSTHAV